MRSAIGIDIGGTHTRAARISADGRILAHLGGPTARSAQPVLADLQAMIASLRDATTTAIGIGVPGCVDARTGRILSGGYVNLSGLPLAEDLHHNTGLETFTDNDANMALVAEARMGAAVGHDHAVLLTIGTGIGGAILAGGQIFHGGGTAGQLGHIAVNYAGAPCKCGRRGCLETEGSGTALGQRMKDAGFPADTGIGDLLQSETSAAQTVVVGWANALRAGIDSLVAAFAPGVVILGGGLGAAAVAALARAPANSPWFQCPVVAAKLGDQAGVVGAGLAALKRTP